jgi:hypothetical protein
MGGSKFRFCHWLYGARLSIPCRLVVEIQPIGRGTVQALNGLNGSGHGSFPGA